ncbi:RNA polymerase subunit sigma-70 [Crossiella sp. CA-258035]|uniref:RNA polymerase subunit sigma-70 n=1 Tax=Crossiella sp. CA-258035 TaxID=2981138 RepID=UPI0024BD4DE2|nr:RNA polymerase subunit sigma-70 [Crossiella sp. CA-258035]WHT18416.1 RNA polymerase subunit sigma-70 [Crossiella sp. CA-258035]
MEFLDQAEVYRRELLAHCYRMLGSVDDAEDVVQETYLRAWRASAGFEGRSSVRTWLYRIATNACLSALRKRDRRVLPSGLGAASGDPDAVLEPGDGVSWVQPLPDMLVRAEAADPAGVAVAREGLRLALVASLQHLSGKQRAVLVLRDVLGWPAAEVAAVLELNVGAVKSLLQRARARLAAVAPIAEEVLAPEDPRARALLSAYMAAFERADAAAVQRLLLRDASLEMTPVRTWFAGLSACVPFLARHVLGEPGSWRTVATAANGQPALAAYLRGEDGRYHGHGVGVLTVTAGGISRISVFGDLELLPRFGLPTVLPAT